MVENYFSRSFELQVRAKFLKRTASASSRKALSVKRAEDCVSPACVLFLRHGSLCTPVDAVYQQRIRYSTKRQPHNLCTRPSQSSSCARKSSREWHDRNLRRGVSNPICRGRAIVHPTLHVSQTFRWSLFTWPIDPATSTETDPTWFAISFDTIVQWDEKK